MASGSKKGRKSRSGSGTKKGSNSRSGSGTKILSNSKGFPAESYEKYLKQVEDSEGFDVDDFPALRKFIPDIVSPLPFQEGGFFREILYRFANLAIDHYNKLNGTSYELVNVLKATHELRSGITNFITFDAKEKHAADAKTFQAKITVFSGSGIVEFARLKDTPSPASSVPNLQEVAMGVSTLSIS